MVFRQCGMVIAAGRSTSTRIRLASARRTPAQRAQPEGDRLAGPDVVAQQELPPAVRGGGRSPRHPMICDRPRDLRGDARRRCARPTRWPRPPTSGAGCRGGPRTAPARPAARRRRTPRLCGAVVAARRAACVRNGGSRNHSRSPAVAANGCGAARRRRRAPAGRNRDGAGHSAGRWHTASTLLPSGSRTKAPK